MERGIIEADERHTVRSIKTAIQGNVIRALVELITNSDDSYIRLEDEKKQYTGVIEILYSKEVGHSGFFAVRDQAEGMSIQKVREGFKKYGAATSGMKTGKRVRGYFGQGAKDALASMVDGKICTFKDNKFTECLLFIENGKPMYEIRNSISTTPEPRSEHGIDANGTIAYFKADPQKTGRVPRLNTVHSELANNYLLRKIMTNPQRKVLLRDESILGGEKIRRLRYQMPEGKETLSDNFTISFSNYGDFPIYISIWRAEKEELNQTGDDRAGGLLIVDEENIVLGISLFKYDNEPLAARFFGEVRIGRFRELLEKEEAILTEERDGLAARHPFCQILIPEIEKRIETKVKDEKLRKQKESESKIDREETVRYKKAFNFLNKIAEIEAQAVTNLGAKLTDQIEDPPDGFCLYPASAQMTVGKRYAFELRLNTKIIHHGSVIKVTCNNSKIRVLTPEVHVTPEDGTGILQKYITVEGNEPNIDGILRAATGNHLPEAKIYVVPEKELLFSEGMAFQPESLTAHPNQSRRVYLLVYVKMIEEGSTIRISSDNDESIHVSPEKITVREADAIRHVAKYELEVWGEGAGQDAIITAQCDPYGYIALLDVRVRSKEDEGKKGKKGMFSKPEFDHEPEPLQRCSYSAETGKVKIYVNFPSVLHYLGEDCRYKKTLSAQVLVADLVSERCFYEIARKRVESGAVLISPQSKFERIQRDARDFSKKYGKKVHEALVAKELVEEDKRAIENQNE